MELLEQLLGPPITKLNISFFLFFLKKGIACVQKDLFLCLFVRFFLGKDFNKIYDNRIQRVLLTLGDVWETSTNCGVDRERLGQHVLSHIFV